MLLLLLIFLLQINRYDTYNMQMRDFYNTPLNPFIQDIKHHCDNEGIVIIDGDNVRGKTSFQISKESLCRDLSHLIEVLGLQGKVGIIFDHASIHEAFYIKNSGLSIKIQMPTISYKENVHMLSLISKSSKIVTVNLPKIPSKLLPLLN